MSSNSKIFVHKIYTDTMTQDIRTQTTIINLLLTRVQTYNSETLIDLHIIFICKKGIAIHFQVISLYPQKLQISYQFKATCIHEQSHIKEYCWDLLRSLLGVCKTHFRHKHYFVTVIQWETFSFFSVYFAPCIKKVKTFCVNQKRDLWPWT